MTQPTPLNQGEDLKTIREKTEEVIVGAVYKYFHPTPTMLGMHCIVSADAEGVELVSVDSQGNLHRTNGKFTKVTHLIYDPTNTKTTLYNRRKTQ